MANAATYSVLENVTVPANGTVTFHVSGSFVAILTSNLSFKIAFDDDAAQFITQGLTIETEGRELFSRLRIDNPNGAALTVTFAYGTGVVKDSRLSLTGEVTLSRAATLASAADVSVAAGVTAAVLAANLNRRRAIIANLSGNAREVRVGDAGAGAAEGIELLPGERIVIEATAEISVFNPHTAAQSVAVLEEIN